MMHNHLHCIAMSFLLLVNVKIEYKNDL